MKANGKTASFCGPRREGEAGLTLIEVLVAIFIVSIGVIGVMATIPVGVDTAQQIIIQDNAVTLCQSKFAEFRRDRINPGEAALGSYHNACRIRYDAVHGGGAYQAHACQDRAGCNNFYRWHDFPHQQGDDYENFADIGEYEWRVVEGGHRVVDQEKVAGPGQENGDPDDYWVPKLGAKVADVGDTSPIKLYLVTVQIRKKRTAKTFRFQTYMTWYD